MSRNAHESLSRVDCVMPQSGGRGSAAGVEPRGGYGIVSPADSGDVVHSREIAGQEEVRTSAVLSMDHREASPRDDAVLPGRVTSAHEAVATELCIQHGCTREADHGISFCSEHRKRRERGSVSDARLALAAEVKRLREDEKLVWREIADRLGISRTYAQGLWDDPDGTKARERKDSYSRPCVHCGDPVSGSEGPANVSDLCADCFRAQQHEDRFWNRETIVATFQRFYALTKRSPSASDGMVANPSIRARMSDERIAEADAAIAQVRLPPHSLVVREFGSWHLALDAAGLPRNPSGGAGHRTPHNRPRGATLARLYHVLHRNGDGGLHEQTVEALSAEHAIEAVADSEDEWIAVLDSAWFAAPVEPRSIFAVVKSPA